MNIYSYFKKRNKKVSYARISIASIHLYLQCSDVHHSTSVNISHFFNLDLLKQHWSKQEYVTIEKGNANIHFISEGCVIKKNISMSCQYCRTGIFRKRVSFGIFWIFKKTPKITIFRNFSEKLSSDWLFVFQWMQSPLLDTLAMYPCVVTPWHIFADVMIVLFC